MKGAQEHHREDYKDSISSSKELTQAAIHETKKNNESLRGNVDDDIEVASDELARARARLEKMVIFKNKKLEERESIMAKVYQLPGDGASSERDRLMVELRACNKEINEVTAHELLLRDAARSIEEDLIAALDRVPVDQMDGGFREVFSDKKKNHWLQ